MQKATVQRREQDEYKRQQMGEVNRTDMEGNRWEQCAKMNVEGKRQTAGRFVLDGYGSQQHGEVCRKDMESYSRKKCNAMDINR